ncbi:hypothetical protein LCGC14_1863110 [marine sediment metagenome]|uniref:Uncharacterized protein n=1 Tax=marine sediment metagenome TaxID=412755 RepID=A0A0F9J5V3_9ZZZZ
MSKRKTTTPGASYRVLTDRLTYITDASDPTSPRKRPGEGTVVSDIPPQSVEWLTEAGAIEEVK